MITKRRALLPVLVLVFGLAACGGGGESDEARAAVVQMLERLGNGRNLAECIAEQLDGIYTEEDLQPLIDARGDFSTVDFVLLENLVKAEIACTPDDG